MHVALTLTSDGDDAAMRRWAPCSLLDNIANSNGTLLLTTIHSTRAGGGGEGGRGVRRSDLSVTEGVDRDIGFFLMTRFTMVDT